MLDGVLGFFVLVIAQLTFGIRRVSLP